MYQLIQFNQKNKILRLTQKRVTLLQCIHLRLSHPHYKGGRWQLLCPLHACLLFSGRLSQQLQPTLIPPTLATLWEEKPCGVAHPFQQHDIKHSAHVMITFPFCLSYVMHSPPARGERAGYVEKCNTIWSAP